MTQVIASEYEEAVALRTWVNLHPLWRDMFVHVGNERKCTPAMGSRFKHLGVSPGFPDYMLLIPKGRYHGLFIELKRRKHYQVSPSQKLWIERLEGHGYRAEVCIGWDEARKLIMEYMGLIINGGKS